MTVADVQHSARAELALEAEEGRPVLVTTEEELHGDRSDLPPGPHSPAGARGPGRAA
jgi:hypothetical protein